MRAWVGRWSTKPSRKEREEWRPENMPYSLEADIGPPQKTKS